MYFEVLTCTEVQGLAHTGKNLKLGLDYGRQAVAKDNGGIKSVSSSTEISEKSFRDVLAAAIEDAPFSREEIGRRIGRSGAAISQWINKGDTPDLAVVFKLEDALDLRLGELIRHHSPEVWVIIETKVSRGNSWHQLTWQKKLAEALIEAPLTARQRDLLRESVDNWLELNLLRGGGPVRGD